MGSDARGARALPRPTEPPKPIPIALTVTTAMSVLGIGKTKLYELLASGDLEAIRVGRRRLVLQASIEGLVERLRSDRIG